MGIRQDPAGPWFKLPNRLLVTAVAAVRFVRWCRAQHSSTRLQILRRATKTFRNWHTFAGDNMSIPHFQDLQALQSLTASTIQFDEKGVSLKMASTSAKQKVFTWYLNSAKKIPTTRERQLPAQKRSLLIVVVGAVVLYRVFKASDWLEKLESEKYFHNILVSGNNDLPFLPRRVHYTLECTILKYNSRGIT